MTNFILNLIVKKKPLTCVKGFDCLLGLEQCSGYASVYLKYSFSKSSEYKTIFDYIKTNKLRQLVIKPHTKREGAITFRLFSTPNKSRYCNSSQNQQNQWVKGRLTHYRFIYIIVFQRVLSKGYRFRGVRLYYHITPIALKEKWI